jgi:nicotinamidase/pyrazinamidase
MKRAFIIVDIQNDFMPGGSLAVAGGDEVVPVINALQPAFELIVATQDWHPQNHGSFASNHPGHEPGQLIELGGRSQVLWPDHCVQKSRGAEFHRALDLGRVTRVFRKGMDIEIDSYSGFFDNGHRKSTGMGEWLQAEGVTHVYIAGVATDYRVKFTALDAMRLGFAAHVIDDACRAVNLAPSDGADAFDEMRRAGVRVIGSSWLRD